MNNRLNAKRNSSNSSSSTISQIQKKTDPMMLNLNTLLLLIAYLAKEQNGKSIERELIEFEL